MNATPEPREIFPMRFFGNRPPLTLSAAEKEGVVTKEEAAVMALPIARDAKDFRARPTGVDDALAPRHDKAKEASDPKASDSSATGNASPSGPDESETGKPNTATPPVISSLVPPLNLISQSDEPVTPAPAERDALLRPETSRLRAALQAAGATEPPAETTGETPGASQQ